MTAAELFGRVVTHLDAAGIPHMLTGSFAGAYHGRPRATQDLDFVIAATAEQLRVLVRSLGEAGYYVDESAALEALAHESQFNAIDPRDGWKVDLMLRKSRPFSQVEFRRRVPISLEGQALYVVTAEDLILSKLEWARLGGSARQLEDVAGLLAVNAGELDAAYLAEWVDALGLATEWEAASRLKGMP